MGAYSSNSRSTYLKLESRPGRFASRLLRVGCVSAGGLVGPELVGDDLRETHGQDAELESRRGEILLHGAHQPGHQRYTQRNDHFDLKKEVKNTRNQIY